VSQEFLLFHDQFHSRMNIGIDGKTVFGTFGMVMVGKFVSYHTLHVRSEGGYIHKTFLGV
jgi:hypothetical protein